jgi:hypothetical protein
MMAVWESGKGAGRKVEQEQEQHTLQKDNSRL